MYSVQFLQPTARKGISIYKLSMQTSLGFEKDFLKGLTTPDVTWEINCYENSVIFTNLPIPKIY